MQSYQAFTRFRGEEETEIKVSSSRCFYDIWIKEEEITIKGPGVDETFYPDESTFTLPDDKEDRAIFLIICFENGML